jgi:hypothetical protein
MREYELEWLKSKLETYPSFTAAQVVGIYVADKKWRRQTPSSQEAERMIRGLGVEILERRAKRGSNLYRLRRD